MTLLHSSLTPLSERVGLNMREAGVLGVLTNTNVAAANTVARIRALFQAQPGTFNTQTLAAQPRFAEAFETGVQLGLFTDGNIAGLTTVEGLVDLTAAADVPGGNIWD